jgi:phosphatidylserine/phosphatidylglycerophosphate/cardiolipin synthase-like enzyme
VSARTALVVVLVVAVVALGLILFWPAIQERGSSANPAPAVPPASTPAPVPAGQGAVVTTTDWYQIAFTTPRYPDRKENHVGGIDEQLVGFIDGAQRTVDVAIYDFDLDNVAQAMARARGRGARVRMVTDTDTLEQKDPAVQGAIGIVRKADIPIVGDKRRPIMHHKFVVVDGQAVLTGSWNFTIGDTYRLNNNAVIFRSPQLAANYTGEFEKMFTERKFGSNKASGVPYPRVTIGSATISTYFSPQDKPADSLVRAINGATSAIDFLAFSFTHDGIAQAVMARSKAGAKVRGVFETTGSETRFSEFGRMREAGLEVYQDGNPYVLHHKVFVIDRRVTVFGSFNFSDNAARANDENMLIVDDSGFAGAFTEEVERVVSQARNPVKERPAQRERERPE